MSKSQNGYRVLDSDETFKWNLPFKESTKRHLVLKPGDGGFVLAHFALWYHEKVESLLPGVWDEWGWASRPIRNSTVTSNHASGTAIDLNAVKHPLGVRGTLRFWLKLGSRKELAEDRINRILKSTYGNVIRGGLNYASRADEMHYELNAPITYVSVIATRLRKTDRGQRIMAVNPGYRRNRR